MLKEKKPWRNDFARQNIAEVFGQRVGSLKQGF